MVTWPFQWSSSWLVQRREESLSMHRVEDHTDNETEQNQVLQIGHQNVFDTLCDQAIFPPGGWESYLTILFF